MYRWQVRAKRNPFPVVVRGGILIDRERFDSNRVRYSGRSMRFDGLVAERPARNVARVSGARGRRVMRKSAVSRLP